MVGRLFYIRGVAGSTREIFYGILSEQTPDSITIGLVATYLSYVHLNLQSPSNRSHHTKNWDRVFNVNENKLYGSKILPEMKVWSFGCDEFLRCFPVKKIVFRCVHNVKIVFWIYKRLGSIVTCYKNNAECYVNQTRFVSVKNTECDNFFLISGSFHPRLNTYKWFNEHNGFNSLSMLDFDLFQKHYFKMLNYNLISYQFISNLILNRPEPNIIQQLLQFWIVVTLKNQHRGILLY